MVARQRDAAAAKSGKKESDWTSSAVAESSVVVEAEVNTLLSQYLPRPSTTQPPG